MDRLLLQIQKAQNIILTTHRQCDGDGLGAELALYFALIKAGKNVKVINVDPTPKKYRFLDDGEHLQIFEQDSNLPGTIDLVLIFDTNDARLVEPLFSQLQKHGAHFAFVDHHTILQKGPKPTEHSYIDTKAASTGEIAFQLINKLGIPLDRKIARCLYTSITFDTQLYRFIRNSPNSHLIAAELLKYDIYPEQIHRHLFAQNSIHKMAFLSKALGQIEYPCEGKLALLKLNDADLHEFQLQPDESRDVIDMLMNIENLEAAVLLREESADTFKISLRSKGILEVLPLAERLGGGGHRFAAGASVKMAYSELKEIIVKELRSQLDMLS